MQAEEEEDTEENSEDDDDDEFDPKNGIFRDPNHDPYLGWLKVAGSEVKEIDFKKILLDDPDVQDMWNNQGYFTFSYCYCKHLID